MNASTVQTLYSRDVLRLATSLPHDDRINSIDGSATLRAPVCGSEMSVDVMLDAGRISKIAFRARACALGQASAAILRTRAVGLDAVDIAAIRNQMEQVLKGVDLGPFWPELAALAYAREYPARHGAILLPYDTLLAALAEAKN
jgi:NifU-like protein involved in Fe-S cluster formation